MFAQCITFTYQWPQRSLRFHLTTDRVLFSCGAGCYLPCPAPCQVSVTKSGNKLGVTIPQFSQNGHPSRKVIRITVENQSGRASFLALTAPWITIPTRICANLNLAYGQTLSILELKPIQPHSRPPFNTEGEKVDMLSLIPPTSINGYTIVSWTSARRLGSRASEYGTATQGELHAR